MEDEAIAADGMLPESLPGFDLAAGLERLRGYKSLYRNLLLDFGADYCGVAGEIYEALASPGFEKAHYQVHILKGLAGNLEATDLQAAAIEMESLVKGRSVKTTPEKELNRIFAKLKNALEQALDATKRIKSAVEVGDVMKIRSEAEEFESESEALALFCNHLVQLAEDFDLDGIQKLMLDLDR
jgi:HPt (histidine-containing phosphotransfer) domain-containing protein